MVRAQVFLPKAHHALRDTAKWNGDWEKVCSTAILTPQFWFDCAMTELRMTSHSQDQTYSGYPDHVANLCGVQAEITEDALDYFTQNNLETRWINASVHERSKHVMNGIANTCAIANNLNEARRLCGRELRVSYLSGDGLVLMDLLKLVMLDDVSFVPSTPIYVPDPEWDAFRDRQAHSSPTDPIADYFFAVCFSSACTLNIFKHFHAA